MAKGGITVTFIVVYNHIPALIAAVEANSRAAPKRVADRVVATAKDMVPVDTGYLQSSIEAVSIQAGKTAEVYANAPYAAYVEYGTYKMAAQPFLGPAFQQHAEELMIEMAGPLIG